jgi:hypothetical protein
MSIYRSRPKVPDENHAAQETGAAPTSIYRRSKAPAGKGDGEPDARGVVVHLPLSSQPPSSEFARLRRLNPVEVVLPPSREWLDGLPPELRPNGLVGKYPRIVNLIAMDWHDATAVGKLFADLLADHRGSRRGFPVEIRHELRALRDYYYRDPSLIK